MDTQARPPDSATAVAVPDGGYAVDVDNSELRFWGKAFTLVWVRARMPAWTATHLRGGKVSGSGTIAAGQGSTNLAPGTGACAVPRGIGPHGTSKVPCL